LTDLVAPVVKKFLTDNEGVVAFFISWNKFSSRGGIDIAQGLRENKHIEIFDASFNSFGSHPKPNFETLVKQDVKAAVKNFREKKNQARVEAMMRLKSAGGDESKEAKAKNAVMMKNMEKK
jgi:hypothetical protein